ncbi:endoplasmic reticulum protein [Crepidotus variabilis]|uniref:Endoplasmic reticulum protein n=1 Tax=Crepidotus variabilis TaxID=179855 RepID=A0A9P6EHY8_9AGAR|nr:endoplasmic reticulum protein [Crepidotus variabilis]
MPYAFCNQPWKGLYLTYTAITLLFVRLPFWTLLYLSKKSWTLAKCLNLRMVRVLVETLTQTGPFTEVHNHLALAPGKGVNGVWVEPVNNLITGVLKEWANISKVESIRIPGYWLHKKGSSIPIGDQPHPDEKLIYALHGGAYIRCSAHPSDPTSAIQRGLLKHVTSVTRSFAIEYRLAVEKPFGEAHPFPTQIIDALAGYNYLINVVGFNPENIIIVGDSAGGNLAYAFTRYLLDHKGTNVNGATIPAPPGALLLLSPWVDLSSSHESLPRGSLARNRSSDYIGSPDGSASSAKSAFLGPHGSDAANTNTYISPGSLHPDVEINFTGFPRTFILAGNAEVLHDSILTFRDRMVKDLGEGDGIEEGDGKVRYIDVADGTHDFLAMTWFEPERTMSFKEINNWVHGASIDN